MACALHKRRSWWRKLPGDHLVSDEASNIAIETLAKRICPFGCAMIAKGDYPLFVGYLDSAPGRETLGDALGRLGFGEFRGGRLVAPFLYIHSAISKASQPRAGNPTPQNSATYILASIFTERHRPLLAQRQVTSC